MYVERQSYAGAVRAQLARWARNQRNSPQRSHAQPSLRLGRARPSRRLGWRWRYASRWSIRHVAKRPKENSPPFSTAGNRIKTTGVAKRLNENRRAVRRLLWLAVRRSQRGYPHVTMCPPCGEDSQSAIKRHYVFRLLPGMPSPCRTCSGAKGRNGPWRCPKR